MLIEDQQRLHMHPEELAMLPDGTAYLLVEFGADTQEEADEKARALMAELETVDEPPVDYKIVDDPEAEQRLWEVREAGLGATAFPPDDDRDHWPGWEDSAVPPEAVGSYLRDLKKLYEKYSLRGAMYGHLGQGCIHSRISFDLQTPGGLTTYRSFMEEAADLVVSYGGSLSGEHGDGQQRAELLPRMYGDELVEAFREFKRIWDPDWKMNPGKVVDPYRIDENLKLGAGYNPPRPDTHFSFEEDGFDFAHATLRCVGVGKCRERGNSGTMCPSFQVLHEEKHTTRGRARMLFEMLQGDVVDKGWRDEDVYDALHLCLSCKGCTNECPVNVDIPTLKSEFLSHHFEGRLRPREHYSMGLIMLAGRLGSRIPAVANFFGQMPPFSNLLKWAGGVAQPRQVPVFADHTFRQWFESRETPNPNGKRVILWADTFNSYWKPETAQACVEVLEDAGCRVVIPAKKLCCGRPLFHYGMLDTAKRFMDDILETLRDDIRAGVPVIGAEPSCLAVFREELPKLMPHDNDVQRLKQNSYQFSEFLDELGYEPPKLHRKALVHGHCHHKNGLGGMDAEEKLLKAMELDFEIPDTGCCGMAGAFGFERGDPYDVSVKCGERVLLPAVREATDDMLIVANGFSCKEQIRQETDREALHVAEVIKMAWDHGPGGAPVGRRPEKGYEPSSASALRGGLTVAAAAAAAYGAFKAWRDTAPEPPPKSKVASLLLRRR
jgi:Fe-S oxidoreductase